MFVNKGKILVLWGVIAGLLIVIGLQSFGKHGLVLIQESGTKQEKQVENQKGTKEPEKSEPKSKSKQIKICISGAVKEPGLVILEEGARLEDGIRMAGGLTKEAGSRMLNLAEVLQDGAFIYIPTEKELKAGTVTVGSGQDIGNSAAGKGRININTADLKTLDELPGVGESTARKIIEYRESKGRFKKPEELKNVPGIGEGKYKRMKDFIKI